MSSKKKPIIIAVISVFVIALLGGGGYFAYLKLQTKTDENAEKLGGVGELLVGDRYKAGSKEEALKPTIMKQQDLAPTKKVVKSLQKENIKLSIEMIRLKEQIKSLSAAVAELEEYKSTNQRFAPLRLKDEMAEIEMQVKSFLLQSEDAERFTTMQIEIMAAASSLEYRAYIIRNRLMVTKVQRKKLAAEYLPGYAFCVGDGIALAANNSKEFNLVASKFRGIENVRLPDRLRKDLDSVMTPCQNALRAQLDKNLSDAG
ncbi:MAG: hypothetical protein MJK10_00400 [Pseudomonadales bacterium]|nr:hypothetical protein [Pseudomonadales bacterium]NRA14338.1 hypothetical protein [Oceanospirillaceae bacterium]